MIIRFLCAIVGGTAIWVAQDDAQQRGWWQAQAAESGNIANMYRRDVVVEAMVKMAVQTGDASYLDRIPKEYLTPEITARIIQARRQIDESNIDAQQRRIEIERRVDEDNTNYLVTKMTEKLLRHEALNLDQDTQNPNGTRNIKAFDYAMSHKDSDPSLSELDSTINRLNMEGRIAAAAASHDWGVLGQKFAGRVEVTPSELRTDIGVSWELNAKDKALLVERLDEVIHRGVQHATPDQRQ